MAVEKFYEQTNVFLSENQDTVISNDTTINGTFNLNGNFLKMSAKISGNCTITNAKIEANLFNQIFDTSVIIGSGCMIDKFSGLVPTQIIESVTKTDREGTIYWLEERLVNNIFNKLNKSESERSIISIDNLNKG